jgi:hypothetical protein
MLDRIRDGRTNLVFEYVGSGHSAALDGRRSPEDA